MKQFNVFLVKQPLAVIKITEVAIHKCFFKKLKVEKKAKFTKIKYTGGRLLILEWKNFKIIIKWSYEEKKGKKGHLTFEKGH